MVNREEPAKHEHCRKKALHVLADHRNLKCAVAAKNGK